MGGESSCRRHIDYDAKEDATSLDVCRFGMTTTWKRRTVDDSGTAIVCGLSAGGIFPPLTEGSPSGLDRPHPALRTLHSARCTFQRALHAAKCAVQFSNVRKWSQPDIERGENVRAEINLSPKKKSVVRSLEK